MDKLSPLSTEPDPGRIYYQWPSNLDHYYKLIIHMKKLYKDDILPILQNCVVH
jgi:hypothetical protein